MVNRVLPFVVAALALALYLSAPAQAADKDANSMTGTVVSFDGKLLKIKDKNDKEHSYDVSAATELKVDGKKSDVSTFKTLKEGTKIRVWNDKDNVTKAVKIEALDKNTEFSK